MIKNLHKLIIFNEKWITLSISIPVLLIYYIDAIREFSIFLRVSLEKPTLRSSCSFVLVCEVVISNEQLQKEGVFFCVISNIFFNLGLPPTSVNIFHNCAKNGLQCSKNLGLHVCTICIRTLCRWLISFYNANVWGFVVFNQFLVFCIYKY